MGDFNIKRMWALLILTILISSAVLFPGALRDDDFCRYDSPWFSCISQNMLKTGNWLNPSDYRGGIYAEHPPLALWGAALSIKLLGESVFSAVFFSLICMLLTCVATFFIGVALKNDIVGFLGAMGLLLTRYVVRVSRHNTNDVPLMLFVTLSVLFIILANKKSRAFYVLFGISTAMAFLSKGVISILLPVICLGAMFLYGRPRDIIDPFFMTGIAIFIITPFVWLYFKGGMTIDGWLVAIGDYSRFVTRAFTGSAYQDPGSRFRFLTRLFEFCWLITPGVFAGVYFLVRDAVKKTDRTSLILLVWIAVFIGAFFVSAWRRGLYLLPIYPSMAVLFGIGVYALMPEDKKMAAVYVLSAFFIGNITAPVMFPHKEPKSIDEVLYAKTYLPDARKALEDLNRQFNGEIRLVSYMQNEAETTFFFSSSYELLLCNDPKELERLVLQDSPIVIYMSKSTLSDIDKNIQPKLKIVYVFGDQLLVSNKTDAIPPFDMDRSK